MGKRIFLTDKEVAVVLEVSEKTLYRMLRGFHPSSRKVCGGGPRVDVQKMQPNVVNGVRRWRIGRVASALGVSEAEILERIS